jgi:superfamily II DNA or RNA helicase
MDRPELVADVVETWIKRGENRSTLCFAVDRAHAKNLQQQFESAGIRCGYIDAYTDSEERERIADLFHDGTYRVVCNVGCLTTGVDWDVRCIILARPTKSEMLFTQIIGRGLRTADGKDDCLILDHSETHLRLGFVTDIHHESLDEGRGTVEARAKATPAEGVPGVRLSEAAPDSDVPTMRVQGRSTCADCL